MLDGFELAGAAWERVGAARRASTATSRTMLDMLCLAGEVGWARLSPRSAELTEPARLAPATPIALFLREHSEAWQTLRRGRRRRRGEAHRQCTPRDGSVARARGVVLHRCARGERPRRRARRGSRSARSSPAASPHPMASRGCARCSRAAPAVRSCAIAAPASPAAGASFRRRTEPAAQASAVEAEAWALLRRYGVVFHRLLTRESIAAPWRDAGPGLPAARSAGGDSRRPLRRGDVWRAVRAAARRRAPARGAPDAADGRLIVIGTADPLNLAGIVTAGDRIRAAARNRLAYRDGVPSAVHRGRGRPAARHAG